VFPYANELTVQDRERQRQLDEESGALTGPGTHLDHPAEALDIAADHVQPDPAAGDIRHLGGGGETRLKNEVVDSILGQGIAIRDEPARAPGLARISHQG
jgi:hypothetical protein